MYDHKKREVAPERDAAAVLAAAKRRAQALAEGDAEGLRSLLHPRFKWTSFKGDVFDRDAYVASNTSPQGLRWLDQRLESPEVVVEGDTALLTAIVVDEVCRDGTSEAFRLRLTQVWVREAGQWLCLGGHAGPRLP